MDFSNFDIYLCSFLFYKLWSFLAYWIYPVLWSFCTIQAEKQFREMTKCNWKLIPCQFCIVFDDFWISRSNRSKLPSKSIVSFQNLCQILEQRLAKQRKELTSGQKATTSQSTFSKIPIDINFMPLVVTPMAFCARNFAHFLILGLNPPFQAGSNSIQQLCIGEV